jgi:hypothetical protein
VPVSPGFPTSLNEYVHVWCADLLVSLTQEQRDDIVQGLAMDEGGPWPSRLSIQRIAERRSGRHGTADDFFGDFMDREVGGIDGVITRLNSSDPGARSIALKHLHTFPGTPQLVTALNAETESGNLTPAERESILTSAVARPVLPEPIPAPAEYPPIPRDHPESWAEMLVRDPPYRESDPV